MSYVTLQFIRTAINEGLNFKYHYSSHRHQFISISYPNQHMICIGKLDNINAADHYFV